jgi:hypothetical protein
MPLAAQASDHKRSLRIDGRLEVMMRLVGGLMAGGLVPLMSMPIYGHTMIVSRILLVVKDSTMSSMYRSSKSNRLLSSGQKKQLS